MPSESASSCGGCLQDTHGECVAKAMDVRRRLFRRQADTSFPDESKESITHGRVRQLVSRRRYEDVIARSIDALSNRQITFQRRRCRWVKRHKATLVELRFANDQPLTCEISKPERQRFRDSQSRRCQRTEQSRKDLRTQWPAWSKAGGGVHQTLQFFARIDVTSRTGLTATEHVDRWYLMPWIFGSRMACESSDHLQS